MSYKDGYAAMNLEMPSRVPRTEYSADTHWKLVSKVTGIDVNEKSTKNVQLTARKEFIKEWNYDFIWSILIDRNVFGDKRTRMGHAEYASGGIDYDNKINELYKTPYDALNFDPWELYGQKKQTKLIEDFNKHYNKQCETVTDTVNMTGIYVSCMSGLLEIFGWDILLAASGLEPNKFGELANRYSEWVFQYFEALAYSEAPIVMIHDDIVWSSGAFIHPDWYRKYIFPNYKKCFKPLIENGKIIIFTSDGNYDEFVDDIAKCQINGFVLEPLTDMKNIAEKYGKTHFFAGNADTRILLSGTKEEIYDEVKRCMDIGKKHPGFFMAVGNHIPSNTPVENALYYNDAYEKLCRR